MGCTQFMQMVNVSKLPVEKLNRKITSKFGNFFQELILKEWYDKEYKSEVNVKYSKRFHEPHIFTWKNESSKM